MHFYTERCRVLRKSRLPLFLLLAGGLLLSSIKKDRAEPPILYYIADPQLQDLQLYWKNDRGEILGSLENLKAFVEGQHKTLVFAMNGGMYRTDRSPQGLFIQQQRSFSPLDSADGSGNFYLKPNGIFYVTTGKQVFACTTEDFRDTGQVQFATQSGPMLVIDGHIHPAFKEGSSNLHIRNGVGILPGNKALFALSKERVNLFDFAQFFLQMGCQDALYFDGFVSRAYLPEKNWLQTDGDFGVMIGVTGAGKK